MSDHATRMRRVTRVSRGAEVSIQGNRYHVAAGDMAHPIGARFAARTSSVTHSRRR